MKKIYKYPTTNNAIITTTTNHFLFIIYKIISSIKVFPKTFHYNKLLKPKPSSQKRKKMVDIIINDNFSEEETDIFKEISNGGFQSFELFKLKMQFEEMSSDKKINELTSYDSIKKNLTYDLPYQREGAIKLLRDLN